jgi:hypothetical protein
MNEYDIEHAVNLFSNDTPNLQAAANTLYQLMQWTNQNSDGWPYWRKPTRAAAKLMDIVSEHTYAARFGEAEDITRSEFVAALTPIKSFLTRQGVSYTDFIQVSA